jgi:ABC-type transport system involved in cytochrome c biogenesis permease subunit
LIIIGGIVTGVSGQFGLLHLRLDKTNSLFTEKKTEIRKSLPFALQLEKFEIQYYEGTLSPASYVSHVIVFDHFGNSLEKRIIQMNKRFKIGDYQFVQMNYDRDLRGVTLAVYRDRGVLVVYSGYLLFVLSGLWWLLLKPRKMKKRFAVKQYLLIFFFLILLISGNAAKTLPQKQAAFFDDLLIQQHGRIMPLQTYAQEFAIKITGKQTYKGYSSMQLLLGCILFPEEWYNEPLIKMKGKNAMAIQECVQLLLQAQSGKLLTIVPYPINGNVQWFAPRDTLPDEIPVNIQNLIIHIPLFLRQQMDMNNMEEIEKTILALKNLQRKFGGNSLPTARKVQSELIYNHFPVPVILFIINILTAIIGVGVTIFQILSSASKKPVYNKFLRVISTFSFLLLSLFIALRIYISERFPLSNGYETMLFLAWIILLFCLCLQHRFKLLTVLGVLLSGLVLGVAILGHWDPKITPLTPVLVSPLLNLHVTSIMFSYALFTIMASLGIVSMILIVIFPVDNNKRIQICRQMIQLYYLSKSLLYPATYLLGCGIILGSIWANISWGRYWSWDPKEISALVIFLVYTLLIHYKKPKKLQSLLLFQTFNILAFVTVIFTYFGVTYFFGGFHSY